MFDSLKKIAGGGRDKEDKKTAPKTVHGTIGGMNHQQIKDQLAKSGTQTTLATPKLSEKTQQTLDELKKPNTPVIATTTSSVDLLQELATFYSEGEIKPVIDRLRKHINDNRGDVDRRFWYMLMDCYQVSQQKGEFDKVAISFAHKFGTSPPSWYEEEIEKKKGGLVGKNILILEPFFKQEHTLKFKEFLKTAKEENFCRINVSSAKFDQSEVAALNSLHKLFSDLRKSRVLSILMGDNNLINFCKAYMNPNLSNKALKEDFIRNEQIAWLLYLEVLQWKGKQEEFETVALDYAMKFEIDRKSVV